MKQEVEWIAMARQRPTKDGTYLVYCASADPKHPFIYTSWWSTKNVRWELIPNPWSEHITHWMPLPKPPKEK